MTVAAAMYLSLLAVVSTDGPAMPADLDAFLERVRTGYRMEQQVDEQRLETAQMSKEALQKRLARSQQRLHAREEEIARQEHVFATNEQTLAALETELKTRLGTMGELFGAMRQMAGQTQALLQGSIISAQYAGRDKGIAQLVASKEIPDISQIEQLWYMMAHEMRHAADVVTFNATVTAKDGTVSERPVTRIGAFMLTTPDGYLQWLADSRQIQELQRQPASEYVRTLARLQDKKKGMAPVAIDPSRGAILALLVQTPRFSEQVALGGIVGYIIMLLGGLAFAVAVPRLLYLALVSRRVQHQVAAQVVDLRNPLGRVLQAAQEYDGDDVQAFERRIEEAVVRETVSLERFVPLVKVVGAVAPLLGLLGTVIGMIKTFQVITLFGNGDPKLMAGGISEALVTTMLGLIVAIPVVLLHTWLQSTARRVADIVVEQSAGIIAARTEEAGRELAA